MAENAYSFKGIKVCLVFPPYRESQDIAFIKAAKRNLGVIPPLSLCAVAAILERCGVSVKVIDANAHSLSIGKTIEQVLNFSPDFLGFTLSTYQFHFTLEWINKIREKLNVPVIVGGPHARIYPRQILTHNCIDYCVIGDAEESLPELIRSMVDKKLPEHIKGIAYRDQENRIRVDSCLLHIRNLDDICFPARHLIDNSMYYSLLSRYTNFTAMTSTRGCPFECTFCDNHCTPYREMHPLRVVDEMEFCKKEFNINEIDMFDGVFSITRHRLFAICEEIGRRKLNIHWSFRARADIIDKELLHKLKSTGCIRIYYGIESGSPKILENIKKREGLGCIVRAVQLTKEAGIETFGYFMVGNSGEDAETIRDTEKIMLSLPFDYVQVAPIFYPPNTAVYAEAMKVIKYDYWGEYTCKPDHIIEFPIVGTEFNQKQIHVIARKMYLRFYLRPSFIFGFLRRLNSFASLKKSARAVFQMFLEVLAPSKIISSTVQ